jgi:hypothetical protein
MATVDQSKYSMFGSHIGFFYLMDFEAEIVFGYSDLKFAIFETRINGFVAILDHFPAKSSHTKEKGKF